MEGGSVRARGRFERREYLAARFREHALGAQGIASSIIAVAGIVAVLALSTIDPAQRGLYLGEAFAFFALGAAIPLLAMDRARKAWNSQPSFRGDIEYLADAEGVEERRDDRAGKAEWREFRSIRERRAYFCIDLGMQRRAFIPKRFFASPEDVELFRELARAAGKPVRGRPRP